MEIRILESSDSFTELLKLKKLGLDLSDDSYDNDVTAEVERLFRETYLTGLETFKAYCMVDTKQNVVSIVSCYISNENAEWYLTGLYGDSISINATLLNKVCMFMRRLGKFKFYSASTNTFSFSKIEKYNTYLEFTVEARKKCKYNNPWQILFNRMLIDKNVSVHLSIATSSLRNKYEHLC